MEIYGNLIIPTSSILECIDPAEYAALSESAKDGVRLILMCGTVDMGARSTVRSYLDYLFPTGVTHTALADRWHVL
jgi:hypothetical protein